jgi:hypothetical protein
MAGNLSDEVDVRSKEFQDFRKQIGPEKFDAFMTKYAWADQGKYVAHAAPAAVFLQFATKEDFLTPDHVRQYYPIVSEPKSMKFYEAPHALNAEARKDRIAFLVKQLSLRAPDAAAIARVPDIPQPPEPK